MQKIQQRGTFGLYAIAAILAYSILNQGGYFAGAIISAGIFVALVLFRANIRLKPVDFVFLAFSIWYLICALRPGFDVRYIAKGILPLLCLLFRFLLPQDREAAVGLCEKVVKLSFYITILAILVGIYNSVTAGRLLRLTFPFQYANTSGIFFGVMLILARHAGFAWGKKRQLVFLVALALTQSVGAIGLTVLAEILLSRSLKKTLVLLGCVLAGAVVLKDRVYQSIGTFIERFLQMHDGLVSMGDNLLFGMGAGRWELAKNLYQTGFYEAKEIHSSVVQIGADAGVIGLLLFLAALVVAFRTIRFSGKAYLAGLLMLLLHSCLDFSLAFTAIGFLIMLLFACGETKEEPLFTLKIATPAVAAILLVGCLTLSVGMYQIKRLDGIDVVKNYPGYIAYYEAHPLSQATVKTTENYAKALYATGEKEQCLTVLHNIDVLSSDMIVLKQGCLQNWGEALRYLDEQPYNEVLYKTIWYNSNDEALQTKAREKLDEAIRSMSFLGKLLYQFKGERIL